MAWAARRDRWWLVGVFGGMALWGRVHVALVVAVLGLGVAWPAARPLPPGRGSVSCVFMALASLWCRWVYGVVAPHGRLPGTSRRRGRLELGNRPGSPRPLVNERGLLVAPDRGLLVWTPLLLLLRPRSPELADAAGLVALVAGGRRRLHCSRRGRTTSSTAGTASSATASAWSARRVAPAVAMIWPRAEGSRARPVGPVLALQLAAFSVGAVSEGFFVSRGRLWRDNSFWLALRTFPGLWAWVGLMLVVGVLGQRVWQDRFRSADGRAAPERQSGSSDAAPDRAPAPVG